MPRDVSRTRESAAAKKKFDLETKKNPTELFYLSFFLSFFRSFVLPFEPKFKSLPELWSSAQLILVAHTARRVSWCFEASVRVCIGELTL